ncbi:MAG: GGDEF domain-containing protein [Patescibacteria group bacterium]|jgi:diguanylate cyclase
MAKRRVSKKVRDLPVRQLRIALAAAYEERADSETRIRALGAEIVRLTAKNDELQELARVDPLTGALNRAGVELAVVNELAFSKRFTSPLSVIAIDVDIFKGINDTYGHPAGDEILKEIIRRFRTALRPYDVIGRMGGDEFVIILRGATPENAALVAERLRKAVAAVPFSFGKSTFSVTISLGVTEAKTKEGLEEADRALYEAKCAGRNCVVADKR